MFRPMMVTLLLIALSAVASAETRPNVLLIMTDDQGWGDVRSHGNELIDTPHLDRLAAAGARFDRFYVDPLCAPTRAALLTGRHALRSGVHGVTRGHETMRSDEVTLAELFRDAGYVTGCFGKWHNGRHYPNHPNGQGFDEFLGFCGGHWNGYFDSTLERNGEQVATRGFITDVLTEAAIEFMQANRERPFLCYVPYNAPHFPPQVPDRYFDKYAARGCDDATATAYGMIENVDENVGRLLAALDAVALEEKTIVLFLTDNGPNTDRFNGDMKGRKGSAHEGGVRVPLLVRWPSKIRAGLIVEPIAQHVDLLPTLCALCDVPLPKQRTLDGRSLAPLLLERESVWPERTLFTFRDTKPVPDGKQGAVRTPRYRAVREGGRWSLYDMQTDPGQSQDIAETEAALVRRLAGEFDAKWNEVVAAGFAPVPAPVGHPRRPIATLPGHEADLRPALGQGIRYHGKAGWANDWIDHWTDAAASAVWPIDVQSAGRYEIVLSYACPAENVGSVVRATIGEATTAAPITDAHDPPPIEHPDRFPRPEVPEKVWKPLSLGVVELPAGTAELVLTADQIVGGQMPQIKAVELRPVQ